MITGQDAETRVQRGFWIHFGVYLLVVCGLAILNYNRNPDNLWVLWVAGGWGLGLAFHALAFVFPESRARMIERTRERVERREDRSERREARQNAKHMTDRMSQAG